MSQITLNTISGVSPFTVFVCDTDQINCILSLTGVTESSLPIQIPIPFVFEFSPIILIKIVDSTGCVITQSFNCITPTPTPSVTVTLTVTSTIAPTPSITSSVTPTPVTPTPTQSNPVTPSVTPTLTVTPSQRGMLPANYGYLFVEPLTGSSRIGGYMINKNLNFLGFSNASTPSSDQEDFQIEMNAYLDFSGWTSGFLRTFLNPSLDNSVVDYSGNSISKYNFQTLTIPKGTVDSDAWYTFIIPTGITNGLFQKVIDVSEGDAHTFIPINTDSIIYSRTFTYTGITYQRGTFRVYTTFPSTELYLDNRLSTLYFKGNTVGT